MESIEVVIVLFIIGLAALLFGMVRSSEKRRLLNEGIRVDGVILQLINDGNSTSPTYFPVVKFKTEQNDWVTERYKIGGNKYLYKEGDAVRVIYDPLNPGRFLLDDTRSKALSPVLIYGGVALILVSIGLLVLGLRG
jgi:type II secretory pathway pseudopilin PulG